jgi:hypothetical protein
MQRIKRIFFFIPPFKKTPPPPPSGPVCTRLIIAVSDPIIPVLHNPSISKIGLKFKDVDSVKKNVAVSISGCLVKVKQK